MRDAAAARGVVCAVVKQNRYNPAMRFLRGMVDEGRVGRLVTAGIRVHWCRGQDYYDDPWHGRWAMDRSEEHTSELQSLMRISYAVFCLKKKKKQTLT